MNKIISATRTIPGFVLTVVAGMLYVSAVTAAPVTVDFTKNDASGSGSLSGAGPNVSRFLFTILMTLKVGCWSATDLGNDSELQKVRRSIMKTIMNLGTVLMVCVLVSGAARSATVSMSPDPASAGGITPFSGSVTATLLSGDTSTNEYVFSLGGAGAFGSSYIFGFEFDNQPIGGVSVLLGVNSGMSAPIESFTDDGAFIQFQATPGSWSATATFHTVNTPTAGNLVWIEEFSLEGRTLLAFSTSAVPVPAAAWLFGSGLLGLVGVARRMNARSFAIP